MQTNTITSAVATLNAAFSEEALREGVRLIEAIRSEKAKIANCEASIKDLQTSLHALSADVNTVESVFGGSVPENANAETIKKVIVAANQIRQFPVEQQATRIASSILAEQEAITALNKRIAELRDKLVKLAPESVSAEQIVG